MAKSLTRCVPDDVTLATSMIELTIERPASSLVIYESDVAVYVVTQGADGGALPATAYRPLGTVTAGQPVEIDISPYGIVLLAGSGAGTARVEVR